MGCAAGANQRPVAHSKWKKFFGSFFQKRTAFFDYSSKGTDLARSSESLRQGRDLVLHQRSKIIDRLLQPVDKFNSRLPAENLMCAGDIGAALRRVIGRQRPEHEGAA
jgi:hypothetical protein